MLTNSQVSDRHIANIAHKACRSAAHQAQVAQEALWHWALGLVERVVLHRGHFSLNISCSTFRFLSPFTIFSRGPHSSRSHRHLPCFWLSSDLVPFCLFSAIAGQVKSNPRKYTRCRPFRADADASLIQLRVDHNPHAARWAGPTSRANCPERRGPTTPTRVAKSEPGFWAPHRGWRLSDTLVTRKLPQLGD